MKRDDHSLTASQMAKICRRAKLLLRRADAIGQFPTPIDDLISAAELEIARDVSLDQSFLGRMYKRCVSDEIKQAIEKVLGVLDSRARIIYLDHTVHANKKPFLSLHEVGHDYLPWQRDTYAILEDSDTSLDPDVRETFEREANGFACEALFQLDSFKTDAADCSFGIKTPITLAKRYGSSVYAAIRRYVMTHDNPCGVAVFNRSTPLSRTNLSLRRWIPSSEFVQRFGYLSIKQEQGPDDFFVRQLPHNKFRSPTPCTLTNVNGEREDCLVEAFDSTWQVFYLIYPTPALSQRVAG